MPASGAKPVGAPDEATAALAVRQMFNSIAPRYDLLNHVLSANVDRLWWRKTARRFRTVLANPDATVLDICCGTGDLAIALRNSGKARVIGADFAHTMLVRARAKSILGSSHSGMLGPPPLPLFEADALRLPFAKASFDLVASAFGFRNLANYEEGLKEIRRVLKPGGTVGILEFSEPPPGLAGDLYRWYCRKLLPKIGGLLSGNPNAYKYLPASVARFFRPEELAALMNSVGFTDLKYELWTFGSVALHTAIKL